MGMTNDEEIALQWKLKELPDGHDVAMLVEQGVITVEEARSILFKKVDTEEKIKALEEQVDFLRGIIKDLSKSRNNQTIYTYPLVQKYIEYVPRHDWGGTKWGDVTVLCSSAGLGSTMGNSTLTTSSGNGTISHNSNQVIS